MDKLKFRNRYRSLGIWMFMSIVGSLGSLSFGQILVGDAINQGGGCYRLTSNANNQEGAVWMTGTINVTQSWEMNAEVYLGNNNGGADGMVFVLRNLGSSMLGFGGGYMGFGGIGNSLGVEMDTYYGAGAPSAGDLTQDHLGIQKNGSVSHVGANVIASPVPALPTNGNIENGNFHDLRVTYDANTSEMIVYFDCNERITTTVDVQETIGSTIAKWGFTAATGGATNIHRVCGAELLPWSADLAPDSVMTCAGVPSELSIAASAINPTWSPAEGLSSVTGSSVTATVSESATYTVEYEDVCGAEFSETIEIVVPELPSTGLPSDSLLCDGGSIDLYNGPWLDGVTGEWEDGSMDAVRTVSASGTYSLTLTDAANGCSQTESMNLMSVELPEFSLGADVLSCPGESIDFDLGIIDPEMTLTWNGASGSSTFSTTEEGPVIVIWSQLGCSDADTTFVEFHPLYSVIWDNNPVVLCLDETVDVHVDDPSWSGTSVDIVWSDGSTGSEYTITTPGQYAATVTTETCSFSFELEAISSANAGVDLGPDIILCDDDEVILTSGYNATSTFWVSGGSANGSSAAATTVSGEDDTVIVEVSIENCVSTDTLVVQHVPFFEIGLSDEMDLCLDDSLFLEAPLGADSYTWSNGNLTHALWVDMPGLYSINVGIGGCNFVDQMLISPSLNVGFELGEDLVICLGETASFSSGYAASETSWWQNGSSSGSGSSWAVEGIDATLVAEVVIGECVSRDTVEVDFAAPFDPDVPESVSFCTGDSAFVVANFGAPEYLWSNGESTAGVWVTDAGVITLNTPIQGCPYENSILATVIPLPTFDLGPDIALCHGQNTTLNTSLYFAEQTNWSNGGTDATLNVNATGLYSVVVTDQGCSSSDSIQVNVQPLPIFELGEDRNLCPDESAFLYVYPLPDGTTVSWSSGQNTSEIQTSIPGTYIATAMLNGCSWTDTVAVDRTASLITEISDLMLLCEGDSMVVSAENPPNLFPITYAWDQGDFTPAIWVDQQGQYDVQVSNACESIAETFEVRLIPCGCDAYVPNAFTPDNDGYNDLFIPVLGCEPTEYLFEVFNPWGSLIFATSSPEEGWMGQVEQDAATDNHSGYFSPDGMYIWRLSVLFDSEELFGQTPQTFSGSVYLLR